MREREIRNRSGWCQVRRKTTDQLHALALGLRRKMVEEGIEWTDGQSRLWVEILAELEWRSARKRRNYPWCTCELCITPFPVEVEY